MFQKPDGDHGCMSLPVAAVIIWAVSLPKAKSSLHFSKSSLQLNTTLQSYHSQLR